MQSASNGGRTGPAFVLGPRDQNIAPDYLLSAKRILNQILPNKKGPGRGNRLLSRPAKRRSPPAKIDRDEHRPFVSESPRITTTPSAATPVVRPKSVTWPSAKLQRSRNETPKRNDVPASQFAAAAVPPDDTTSEQVRHGPPQSPIAPGVSVTGKDRLNTPATWRDLVPARPELSNASRDIGFAPPPSSGRIDGTAGRFLKSTASDAKPGAGSVRNLVPRNESRRPTSSGENLALALRQPDQQSDYSQSSEDVDNRESTRDPAGQEGYAEIHIDGTLLGRWVVQHLEQVLSKPPTGPSFIDSRQMPAYPGRPLTT